MKDLVLSNSKEVMTSLQVSEITGKQHSNVMRDIRILCQQLGNEGEFNFELANYLAESNFGLSVL